MTHIVLLGDSIFDNGGYIGKNPDVRTQLAKMLPKDQVTLLASDGDKVQNVAAQLAKLPRDATHLVISAGGNDALGYITMMSDSARSVAEVLARMADVGETFQSQYQAMLKQVLSHQLPTVLCTIYYPRMPDPDIQRLACTALIIFNDVITRAAFNAGVPLIDLRAVCSDAVDYANAIEPSAVGGAKIATIITETIRDHDFSRQKTQVFF